MKKEFRFENVLRYRKQLADIAMADYLKAKKLLDEGLAELDQMYRQVDENFIETQNVRQKGGVTAESLKTHDEFFVGMQIHITRQKEKVRELKEVVEEKQQILVEKSVDQQSLVKLKEKHDLAYRQERKKKEQMEVEDIIVMRAARKTEI